MITGMPIRYIAGNYISCSNLTVKKILPRKMAINRFTNKGAFMASQLISFGQILCQLILAPTWKFCHCSVADQHCIFESITMLQGMNGGAGTEIFCSATPSTPTKLSLPVLVHYIFSFMTSATKEQTSSWDFQGILSFPQSYPKGLVHTQQTPSDIHSNCTWAFDIRVIFYQM